MARETKVGMLAGLTFIICFAVILSNRGGRHLVTSDISALFEDGNDEGKPAEKLSQFHQTAQMSQINTVGNVPDQSGTGRVARLERKLELLSQDLRSRRTPNQQIRESMEESPAAPAVPDPDPPRRTPGGVYHKVRAGETLSKIAAQHYGSKSRRFIDVVFDANRAILSNPDDIRAGMELFLPAVGDAVPQRAIVPERPPQSGREKRDRSLRWYQIRKNDRYVTIAGEQLGDRSRWKEIYDLNRAVFPDAGLIREGVLIKLPAVAHAEKRR